MKHAARERVKQVNIRLTESEAAALAEHAAEANLDLSTFVRRKALEKIVEPEKRRVMSASTASVIRELTAIGTSLLRIVRLYEAENPEAREQLEASLRDVQAAMLRL